MQTLAPDVKAKQEAKLAELRKVADAHAHSELERKLALRYHKIKFFGEQVIHLHSAVACFAHQPTFRSLSLSRQCTKMICMNMAANAKHTFPSLCFWEMKLTESMGTRSRSRSTAISCCPLLSLLSP
jgi:hypothetical protein